MIAHPKYKIERRKRRSGHFGRGDERIEAGGYVFYGTERERVNRHGDRRMSGMGDSNDVPFKDNIIHIKKAVKVRASGKIKRSTIHNGAF